MKKLHELAKKLQENNYTMTDEIKEEFEDFLSIIAEGSRIFHPVFGLGTVKYTQGNTWVVVKFDNDIKDYEKIKKEYALKGQKIPYWYNITSRAVHINKCISIHTLIKENCKHSNNYN